MEKSWGSVFSPRSQAGTALGMSVPVLGLEQDRKCVVQRVGRLLCCINSLGQSSLLYNEQVAVPGEAANWAAEVSSYVAI